jgi:hypothetical protein
MHYIKIALFFFACVLHCFAVDFDVVVIGSSPIPLLEALYHHYTGKRVLVLEAASVLGGAWKSIEICGLYPVDLGCHTLGQDKQMLHFFKEYIGCEMVSIDNPKLSFEPARSPNGFYFNKGCYELIHNLIQLIERTNIEVLLDHKIESVKIDPIEPIALIKTREKEFTTSKILVTSYSSIQFDSAQKLSMTQFNHLYMLIEDPTPARFSFRSGIGKGISRLMNLTHFVGLEGTGRQLIVFQTFGEITNASQENFLEVLKKNDLVHASARIVRAEKHIYEQGQFHMPTHPNAQHVLELLKTNHINDMMRYIPKWKTVFKPYGEVFITP